MKTLALNNNNDIYMDSTGKLAIATDAAAVGNVCLTAVRTLQGELQLNTEKGIPFFDILYTQKSNLDLFRYYLQKIINNIDGVLSIKKIQFETNDNKLVYNLTVRTEFGDVAING